MFSLELSLDCLQLPLHHLAVSQLFPANILEHLDIILQLVLEISQERLIMPIPRVIVMRTNTHFLL